MERALGEASLSDGQWHTLQLLRNGSVTALRLDGARARLIQHPTQDFGGLDVLSLSIGGVPAGPGQQKTAAGEGVWTGRWRGSGSGQAGIQRTGATGHTGDRKSTRLNSSH